VWQRNRKKSANRKSVCAELAEKLCRGYTLINALWVQHSNSDISVILFIGNVQLKYFPVFGGEEWVERGDFLS